MPQGRRKIPFSGKAKKLQLQEKKQRKNFLFQDDNYSEDASDDEQLNFERSIKKINKQPRDNRGKDKYALQFFNETKEEIQQRKEDARKAIEPCPLKKQKVCNSYFPAEVDMSKRPPWNFSMSKEELEAREQRYFTEYLKEIENLANISYFELNIDTWRQLWRVIEMSDVLLIIVDIRYPVMMFPPYLYNYVTNKLGKDMILILNKIDLAPAALVVAWKHYFLTKYPKLHVLMFTSFPTYNLSENTDTNLQTKRRKGKLRMAAEGAKKIMEICKSIVRGDVDLTSWEKKIDEEMLLDYDLDDLERNDNVSIVKNDTSFFKHEKYKNGVLTIGCVGTPNVGKSSLINALMGKKVVSVSRTPGHTKHFQTIYLTKNVRLCDCPGLVFPSLVPKTFQILMGSFPIAQTREPYTTIKFVAERLDLPKLLKLQHQDNDDTWCAMDICDAWAAKKNYYTARAARLDSYRAANSLLRMCLEGQICVYTYPPRWSVEEWGKHPEVEFVRWIQARVLEDIIKYHGLEGSKLEIEKEETSEECSSDEIHSEITDKSDDSNDSHEKSYINESPISIVFNKFNLLQTAQ